MSMDFLLVIVGFLLVVSGLKISSKTRSPTIFMLGLFVAAIGVLIFMKGVGRSVDLWFPI